jgi:chorismate mutase
MSTEPNPGECLVCVLVTISEMKKLVLLTLLGALSCPFLHAQSVTVTADAGPDESMSQTYMALDRDCRNLVNKRTDPVQAVAACKKVADEADKFAPQSHFVTRREAYVFYAIALIQAKSAQQAVAAGDKAVAVVLLGHDDGSGSSAAYGVRGQAKAFAGDLRGADEDLNRAEEYERNALSGPAGQSLSAEYTKTLKGLLSFHAQVLTAMAKQDQAAAKLNEANKL